MAKAASEAHQAQQVARAIQQGPFNNDELRAYIREEARNLEIAAERRHNDTVLSIRTEHAETAHRQDMAIARLESEAAQMCAIQREHVVALAHNSELVSELSLCEANLVQTSDERDRSRDELRETTVRFDEMSQKLGLLNKRLETVNKISTLRPENTSPKATQRPSWDIP